MKLVAATILALFAGSWSGPSVGMEQPESVPAPGPIAAPTMTDAKPRDYSGLHNVVAYYAGFLSGSVPEGGEGFDTLKAMGVRTIISVDGAEPDVALARARGMKYIHLPIGYNGFDEKRKLELSRATRDAMKDGPVYIHCHHGKHRSAGAAAAIAATLGWSTPEQAVERMRVSGTAPNYKGLYSCARESGPLDPGSLDAIPADFPEVSRPAGLVKSMIEIDEAFENLRLIEREGWKAPADHPDLVPVAEAGKVADLYRLLESDGRVRGKPAEFLTMLRRARDEAQEIEALLGAPSPEAATIGARFKLLSASCKDCHAAYRD